MQDQEIAELVSRTQRQTTQAAAAKAQSRLGRSRRAFPRAALAVELWRMAKEYQAKAVELDDGEVPENR